MLVSKTEKRVLAITHTNVYENIYKNKGGKTNKHKKQKNKTKKTKHSHYAFFIPAPP